MAWTQHDRVAEGEIPACAAGEIPARSFLPFTLGAMMGLTKSLVEITHDEGYGDDLLLHINNAFRQKDMRADRIVTAKEPLVEKATRKYRKKPVLIDAWLWDETKETYAILKEAGLPSSSYSSHVTKNWVRNLRIPTREGTVSVEKGDWIIKYTEGGFFRCSPETFEATFEAST